ncbi:MAG: hypothetical protein ACK4SQ_14375 [Allorhizobium sp.]
MELSITEEWLMRRAALEDGHDVHACNCIGPQNGQPVCPCRMRGVSIEDGRYVERRDLGPAHGQKNNRVAGIRLAAKSLERDR